MCERHHALAVTRTILESIGGHPTAADLEQARSLITGAAMLAAKQGDPISPPAMLDIAARLDDIAADLSVNIRAAAKQSIDAILDTLSAQRTPA
jgi:uncharacterized protein with beta-barrel porin domain